MNLKAQSRSFHSSSIRLALRGESFMVGWPDPTEEYLGLGQGKVEVGVVCLAGGFCTLLFFFVLGEI